MDESLLKQLQNFTILCVEDEEGIRRRLVATLRYYFGRVIEAADGEEGLDRFYETHPDIVLSDIEMPLENGIAMVREIRKLDRRVPIVMVTAYSNEEYLLDLINLNISHYILKPVNAHNLLEGILKALDDRLNRYIDLGQGIRYDTERQECLYHDTPLSLRKRDKEFLLLLHRHAPAVTPYDHIAETLWQDRPMTKGALNTFIKELRNCLPHNIIENVPLEGYRLKK